MSLRPALRIYREKYGKPVAVVEEGSCEHEYAIAVATEDGIFVPALGCKNLEQLQEQYKKWQRHLPNIKIIPIEFLENTGKYQVLDHMLSDNIVQKR